MAEEPGWSDYTESKQEIFARVFRAWMSCARNVLRNAPYAYPKLVFIDLTAGPGIDREGVKGSPVIAAEVADKLAMPIDRWLFERVGETRLALARTIGPDADCWLIGEDHRDAYQTITQHYRADTIRRPIYGLIYFDPNGDRLPVDALNALTIGRMATVDILAHLAANSAYKRRNWQHGARLADDLKSINKSYWWISPPHTQNQWCFLLGSNYHKLPAPGFVSLGSAEGRDRLRRLNLTESERRSEDQPQLPFLTSRIAPTRNTSSILAIEPSGQLRLNGPAAGVSDADDGRRWRPTI